jgi:peptidoglycan hydrolase-like protein with peptidoglycan-binding domain
VKNLLSFEGQTLVGLGLADQVGFRVLELKDPYRVAVDVAHGSTGAAAAPLLRRGDHGPAVAVWQRELNRWLGDDIAVDGIYGPVTEGATIGFQRAADIAVDGIVGPQTRAAMRKVLDERPVLSWGDRGPAVARWQDRLNDWLQVARTDRGRLAVDGIFGPRTEAATRDLQGTFNIAVDGIVGPATRAALAQALARQT